jgi:hypothetical protein
MNADPPWKSLYKAAWNEKEPPRLRNRLPTAELAMTLAALEMLNGNDSAQEYQELMAAIPTSVGNQTLASAKPDA